MLLKFMTMNTEDENRDEIEAQEVDYGIYAKVLTNQVPSFIRMNTNCSSTILNYYFHNSEIFLQLLKSELEFLQDHLNILFDYLSCS